jgi:hypothetical protein
MGSILGRGGGNNKEYISIDSNEPAVPHLGLAPVEEGAGSCTKIKF